MVKTEFLSMYRFQDGRERTVVEGQDGLVAGRLERKQFS